MQDKIRSSPQGSPQARRICKRTRPSRGPKSISTNFSMALHTVTYLTQYYMQLHVITLNYMILGFNIFFDGITSVVTCNYILYMQLHIITCNYMILGFNKFFYGITCIYMHLQSITCGTCNYIQLHILHILT
jgi:hypothetical protein